MCRMGDYKRRRFWREERAGVVRLGLKYPTKGRDKGGATTELRMILVTAVEMRANVRSLGGFAALGMTWG